MYQTDKEKTVLPIRRIMKNSESLSLSSEERNSGPRRNWPAGFLYPIRQSASGSGA